MRASVVYLIGLLGERLGEGGRLLSKHYREAKDCPAFRKKQNEREVVCVLQGDSASLST